MRTKGRVREYADKHPTATVREIQTALGLSSPSVVQFHLKVDSKDNIIEAKEKRIAELEAALSRVVRAYDDYNQARTADFHNPECGCLQCAVDNAEALTKEG